MSYAAGFNAAILTTVIIVTTFFNKPLHELTTSQQQTLADTLAISYESSSEYSRGYFDGILKNAEDHLGPIDTPYLTPRQIVSWYNQPGILNSIDNTTKYLRYCIYYPIGSILESNSYMYCRSKGTPIDIQILTYPYNVNINDATTKFQTQASLTSTKIVQPNTDTSMYNYSNWVITQYAPNELQEDGKSNTFFLHISVYSFLLGILVL